MEDKVPVSFVIPACKTSVQVNRTIKSLKPIADSVQIICASALADKFESFPLVHQLNDIAQNLSQLLNRVLPVLQGEFVALLPAGVEILPQLPQLISAESRASAEVDFIYGDYFQKDEFGHLQQVQANPCADDITEREDWGPLEFYRVEALRRMGGCDENLRFRPDYDLRLKLTCRKPAAHIMQPLCCSPYASLEQESHQERLFFPGRGRLGGFSYLFMNPEEEQEVEEIFSRALRQRNAFLAEARGGIFPRPRGCSPRVSVIIPVHNRPGLLPLAVRSVLQGLFQDFEIIIVDNTSSDGTLQVARGLADQDCRIKVISLGDNIIAKALNAGVKRARGEYIAQLDSDDEYTPDTLTQMVRHLDAHRDQALAISYYELMDEQGNTLRDFGAIKHLEYNRNNILRVDGAGAVRVWRKAAIAEFGGFDEKDFGHYGEDYDLILKVSEKYEVGRVHQVLYRYRRHPGNSDMLRPHAFKLRNKTRARQRAIQRRQILNQRGER